ncbi:MAG TPA: TolC family protein [Candidatus Didemnitutus sp.]|nr:TolC family protein [Candidatus Didemnitutus sp.]
MKRILLISLLGVAAVCSAQTNNAPLTLDEAITLAISKSKAGQLGRLKVETADAELKAAQRVAFPQLHAYGAATHLRDPMEVKVGQGSLTSVVNQTGSALGLGPFSFSQFPTQDLSLAKGSQTPRVGSLMFVQPLSQLWRIDSGVRAAKAGVTEAQRESQQIDAKLRLAIEELFAGLVVESRRTAEKQATLAWQERRLRDAEVAQQSGELLDESVLGLKAAVIQARTELTRSQQDYARLSLQLADLIGRSGADNLVVADNLPTREDHSLEYWTSQAANNPERMIAAATLEKATAGVRASRQAYIPEVSLVGGAYAQEGIPLVSKNNAIAGLALSWDVFDFGRRRADISRAVSQRRAAEVNRDRLEEEAARQIRLAHQDVVFGDQQIALAQQAVAFRKRAAELAHQSAGNGLALETAALEADAELRKSETDLLGASCQRHVALLHLYFLSGKL